MRLLKAFERVTVSEVFDPVALDTGAQYGYFTDKIIAERHAPQAHIHCKKGWARERDRHFWALDLDCHLVWPQRPS